MKKTVKFPSKVLKPIQDYLSAQKKKLEKRKKSLSKEDPYADPSRVSDNASPDTDAAEESGHERITALKEEIDRTLIRIKKTLSRIKLGKYGICVDCGRMIDTERLAADPTVERCIDCKKKKQK